MAQLAAFIISHGDEFRRVGARLLRTAGVPVAFLDENRRPGAADEPVDVAVVDVRTDLPAGLAAIERLRAKSATTAIFAVASVTDPEVILQAMRAGANEFFTWPPAEEAFRNALRRTIARRDAAQGPSKQPTATYAFLGAKGGSGTTTIAANCAVDLARLSGRPTIVVDLKGALGEIALFMGIRPRFTILDAIDNLHRLDREFLKELVVRHKSGVEILAASEQFDRPNAADAAGVEELLRLLARHYDYIVLDVGNAIDACGLAGMYAADAIFIVTNADVPSVRNAQRLVERLRQIGCGADRIRLILNRAAEPYLIAPKQIEAATGYQISWTFPNDFRAVSSALNSGVPLSLANHSDIATEFERFTRQLANLTAAPEPAAASGDRKRTFFSIF